jgi:RNA polymerase sigma-70 factor, ECF subfamily
MIYLRHWFKITMTQVLEAAAINSHAMTTSNADDQRQMLREFEEHTMPLMPRMLAQARALTNSEQDAQDLVQETYLKAFRAWKQFELGTNLKAWLVRIMKNTNLNNLEKSNRDKTRGSIDELEDWQVGGAESLTARASRSAESEALENLPTSTVMKALDALPPEFREVVLQAIVVGLPYAEIAENMGTPVGTVMSRLHRGKKALRVALADFAREEGYLNENELEAEQE